MPSAASKKKRAAQRASQFKVSKDTGCPTSLDDEVARFNEERQHLNNRKRDLLARIASQNTERSIQRLEGTNKVAQSRPSGANANASSARSSQSSAQCSTESHGHMANNIADRYSKGGLHQAESHGRMANSTAVRENPLTLLQNSYPERITAASATVVEELLDLLNMYEPPSEPAARKDFESQVYAKVKRTLRNQKQRAYRKAKKLGML